MKEDIRWEQRFNNYRKALSKLGANVSYIKNLYKDVDLVGKGCEDMVSNIEDILKQGLIQSFEFTHELAWKVMQDFAKDQGNAEIRGSKDATRYAAQVNLVDDAQDWMNMILSRNETSHTYNSDTANVIFCDIVRLYYPLFVNFEAKIESIRDGEQRNLRQG
jgi:nucleotidyltransferase substrate binding protein (TIGR01987 family)